MLALETSAAWLLFNAFGKLTPRRQEILRQRFGSLEAILEADIESWQQAGVRPDVASALADFRQAFKAEPLQELIQREGISLVTILDQEYPPLLREIYDCPPLLYCRGLPKPPPGQVLAVVGSRQPSAYSQVILPQLLESLSGTETTIVSGLALGIDALSHECALRFKLPTWSFIGSGLDRGSIYPSENLSLCDKIVAAGGVIFSEFPPLTRPERFNFPKRNRLIAGASRAVFVVEAAVKSGALITARCALDQNREVLALPGDINRGQSYGPNQLLREGAVPITSPDDLKEALGLGVETRQCLVSSGQCLVSTKNNHIPANLPLPGLPLPPEIAIPARRIWEILGDKRLSADEIARAGGFDTKIINSILSVMEITGRLSAEQGYYRRLTANL
jgi:DNA processing protein